MNMSEQQLKEAFQSCCEYFFKSKFQENRFLYFDKIPHSYFGTDYKVEITRISYSWNGDTELTYNTHMNDGPDYGKKKCELQQDCSVSYFLKLTTCLRLEEKQRQLSFMLNH